MPCFWIRPNRRPPHPQQPIFAVFRRGGLHFGRHFPYESHSCRRCVDSMLLMPPPPPNRPGSGYHRARECSSSAQRRPGPKLMPRGHSANNEWSTRPRAGPTFSDATRQHHVSNSPRLPWIAVQQCACIFPVNLSSIEIGGSHFQRFWALLNAGSGNCMRLLCGAHLPAPVGWEAGPD